MDSRVRTIAKSLTWRATALIITAATVWFVTGKLGLAAAIGAIDTTVKLGAYYFHERCWLKSNFGKQIRPEYEI